VAWQGWALALVPAVFAAMLMGLILFSEVGDSAWVEIGFFAAVMTVAAVTYGIAVDRSERVRSFRRNDSPIRE
jgi:hypothetical protein